MMRIWDVPPAMLCRNHLLAEHAELHALWTVLTEDRAGYAHHPETKRWRGKLAALAARHDAQVAEMIARGYNHASPLEDQLATGYANQDVFVDAPSDQLDLLEAKPCPCPLRHERTRS